MMTLPEELQQRFETQIKEVQEEQQMPLLSRMELRAIERTTREDIVEILEVRFESIPPSIIEQLEQVKDIARLKQRLRLAISSPSLEAFEEQLQS